MILVDIQNDFVGGGALAVPAGDEVVTFANNIMDSYDLVFATADWHPEDHRSFASQYDGRNVGDIITLEGLEQILWPDHCVEDTRGAEFVAGLNKERIDKVIQKGMDVMIDSYSGFFDNGQRKATGLGDYLKEKQADEIAVMGLATDYCVKFTAIDAVKLGFKTMLLLQGCRGVELSPGDCERAVEEMKQAGVVIQKD